MKKKEKDFVETPHVYLNHSFLIGYNENTIGF